MRQFGVQPAEITLGLGKYRERCEQPVRGGHLLAFQLPSAEVLQGGAYLVLVEHPSQLGRRAVGKLGEQLEAVPVPVVRGALRDDADTVDVIDSCPLRKQLLGEPSVEA